MYVHDRFSTNPLSAVSCIVQRLRFYRIWIAWLLLRTKHKRAVSFIHPRLDKYETLYEGGFIQSTLRTEAEIPASCQR